jgi:hypothetical protein
LKYRLILIYLGKTGDKTEKSFSVLGISSSVSYVLGFSDKCYDSLLSMMNRNDGQRYTLLKKIHLVFIIHNQKYILYHCYAP